MSAIEDAIDRAVAVELIRSTASVVPSPTRFPNPTLEPSTGGFVRRRNSPARVWRLFSSSAVIWLVDGMIDP